MALFKKDKPEKAYTGPPIDPHWQRNALGKYYRLTHLNVAKHGLNGYNGVFVIWHSGVKPGWVYVGKSTDLGSELERLADDEEVMEFEKNGGLYVTWSPILGPKQNGVLRYLHENMMPKVGNPVAANIEDGPIAVVPPGKYST